MHTNETRVSQAVRTTDAGAASHEDLLNPGEVARRFDALTRQAISTTNSGEAATVAEVQPTSGSLTEAQLATFWDGIVANLDAARRVASKIVSRQNVDDVVHSAALRFVESLQGPKPSPFPESDGALRALFLDIVRRYAVDCIRDRKRPQPPMRSQWGVVWEPVVKGHNVPDRELDSVFARNDEGDYDAPTFNAPREQDSIDQLHRILQRHLNNLSQAQREILVESFYKGEKRADIVACRGITVSTYDNHRQAAFKALRESLAAEVEASKGIDRSIWYDRIEELIERRAARLRGGSSSTKGKGSNDEGKRSNSECERARSEDKRGNSEGERHDARGKRPNARANRRVVKGERRAVKDDDRPVQRKRSNAAHEQANDLGEGAAAEPPIVAVPAARNQVELAGRGS